MQQEKKELRQQKWDVTSVTCYYASLIHNNKRCGFTECDEALRNHGILDVSITCTTVKNLDFSHVVMFKCKVL